MKICLVLLFGSIYQHSYFSFFLETATCFICFLLLEISLFNAVQT